MTGSFTPKSENMVTHPDASQKASARAVLACAWPAILLATLCLIPFLNKPFINDDTWFLTMARQIVKHPLRPMDFDICWNLSNNCLRPGNALMGEEAQGYALVPTVLGGAHEWMAHLTQLGLVWTAVLAMTSLVLRFGWERLHAIAGALILVAVAPFLPLASTAMPDILATALALVAVERLAAWKAERQRSQGVAAALALGLAPYARPHLGLLLPLAAFFLLDNIHPSKTVAQIRRDLWLWTPVLAGTLLLFVVIAATHVHRSDPNPPTAFIGAQHLRNNLRSYLLYFVFPLPLGAYWLANRLKIGRWLIVSIVIGLAVASLFSRREHRLASAFAIIGFCVLADLFFEALRRRDHTGIFLLLWVLIPLPIVIYIQLPIKYLLPCLPAVILLCFRLMEGFSVRMARAAACALIVASTGYSLLILHSDAEYAQFGRDALYRLIQPSVAAGETVWFSQQFSSYWYAPLAGARLTFLGGPQPASGDLLVVGRYDAEDLALTRFPHRTLVRTTSHKYRFGRTMGVGKGFYSNLVGYWLWGFGESPDDRYELWRID